MTFETEAEARQTFDDYVRDQDDDVCEGRIEPEEVFHDDDFRIVACD